MRKEQPLSVKPVDPEKETTVMELSMIVESLSAMIETLRLPNGKFRSRNCALAAQRIQEGRNWLRDELFESQAEQEEKAEPKRAKPVI